MKFKKKSLKRSLDLVSFYLHGTCCTHYAKHYIKYHVIPLHIPISKINNLCCVCEYYLEYYHFNPALSRYIRGAEETFLLSFSHEQS